MADADEPEMLTEAELASATDEELVERVMNLQQDVYSCQKQVAELENLVYFLLDVRAGVASEMHPDVPAGEDDVDGSSTPSAEHSE